MATGEVRGGILIITVDLNTEYLSGPDGGRYLPCSTCGVIENVMPHVNDEGVISPVVSFQCANCALHAETCDDMDCTHPLHATAGSGAPRDAATATGMYDRD